MSFNGGTKYTKLEIFALGEGKDGDKIEISMIEEFGDDCEGKKPLAAMYVENIFFYCVFSD